MSNVARGLWAAVDPFLFTGTTPVNEPSVFQGLATDAGLWEPCALTSRLGPSAGDWLPSG